MELVHQRGRFTLTKFKTLFGTTLLRAILNVIKSAVHRKRTRSGHRIVRLCFDELPPSVTVTTRGKDLIVFPQIDSFVNSISIDHRVAVKILQESRRTIATTALGKVEHVVRMNAGSSGDLPSRSFRRH